MRSQSDFMGRSASFGAGRGYGAKPMTTDVAPERSLKLYELTTEYATIKALLDATADATFDIPELEAEGHKRLEEVLDRLDTAIEKKAEGILFVYGQQNAEADLIGREAEIFEQHAKALRSREQAKRNGAERLKDYLALELGKLGDDTQRFETPRVRATLAKRPQDVVMVTDPDRVGVAFRRVTLKMPAADFPQELAKYVTSVEIEKSAINEVYKREGIVPAGCETAPGKRSLRIS